MFHTCGLSMNTPQRCRANDNAYEVFDTVQTQGAAAVGINVDTVQILVKVNSCVDRFIARVFTFNYTYVFVITYEHNIL